MHSINKTSVSIQTHKLEFESLDKLKFVALLVIFLDNPLFKKLFLKTSLCVENKAFSYGELRF
jgi:hypothetical protein